MPPLLACRLLGLHLWSEKLKKAVAVSEETIPEGEAPIFQQQFSLPESAQTLAKKSFVLPEIGEDFSSSVKSCRKSRPQPYGMKDSRSSKDGSGLPPPPLSGPILRDTARLSQRYPPIARYGVFGVSTWPIGCDTPSPFSQRFPIGEHAKCESPGPPKRGYLSDTCAIPYQNKANGATPPSAILSRKGVARYGGVSRTGPLSSPQNSAEPWVVHEGSSEGFA